MLSMTAHHHCVAASGHRRSDNENDADLRKHNISLSACHHGWTAICCNPGSSLPSVMPEPKVVTVVKSFADFSIWFDGANVVALLGVMGNVVAGDVVTGKVSRPRGA